jgi:hypothetical protein
MKTQEFIRSMANMLPDSAGLCTKYVVEFANVSLRAVRRHPERSTDYKIRSIKKLKKDISTPNWENVGNSALNIKIRALCEQLLS